jgi:Sulfotransferase family
VEIVFIGGAERTGPSALAEALAAHPRFASLPVEAGFHCETGGVAALLEGRVRLERFIEQLRGRWWQRADGGGGLVEVIDADGFEAAVEGFVARFHEDPVAAAQSLFGDLLGPWLERSGRPCLVEHTPRSIWRAQTLRRLFEGARFIHALRDGREVARAIAVESDGRGRPLEGMDRWVERLRAIDAGAQGEEDGARYDIGRERLVAVVVDDLADGGAQPAADLARLLSDAEGVEEGLPGRAAAGLGSRGAWRREGGRLGGARLSHRYERALRALERERNHAAPALLAALRTGG